MEIPNFGASFLTFRVDWENKPSLTASHAPPFTLNNARIQIESICSITDIHTGQSTQYVLGASCKTEYVGVDEDIWTQPNADFCIILSESRFLILKSWDRNNKGVMRYPPTLGVQPERQSGLVEDTYDSVNFHIRTLPAEPLSSVSDIVNATLRGDILVGRIGYRAGERYDVLIDFPVKTMNANEREWIYQTDTGPILYPDFAEHTEHHIDSFRLAYVAVNCPDWAELIVQVPTPLTDDISVNHYSKSIHLDTTNTIFRAL